MNTPYAEQAEQARCILNGLDAAIAVHKKNECLELAFEVKKKADGQRQLVKALDTLARVEALTLKVMGTKSYNNYPDGVAHGWNECLKAVLKALEGEDATRK